MSTWPWAKSGPKADGLVGSADRVEGGRPVRTSCCCSGQRPG